MIISESTPMQRAASLTYRLTKGQSISSREAAEILEVSQRTAQRTLAAISQTVPIYRDDETGHWLLLPSGQISPY